MPPMSDRFLDTNVILYLLADGAKADRAEEILAGGGVISVQVLNEALVNCRRKAGLSWDEASDFLSGVRKVCRVTSLTTQTHDIGQAIGARFGFAVYDAMIVAAALEAGCSTLLTEDLSHGQVIEQSLQILNPFATG